MYVKIQSTKRTKCMELPSTLNNKEKLGVSLAIKPGSRRDAQTTSF